MKTKDSLTICVASFIYLVPLNGANATLKDQLEQNPHQIVREAYHNGNWELFICNANGSGHRNLTNTPEINELYPQVSPDGKKICFLVDKGEGRSTVRSLWLMKSDGAGRKKVADYARQPCWTADSNRLLWLPQEYKKWSVTDYFSKGLMYYDLRSGKSTPHPNSAKMHHLYNPTF